MQVTNALDKAKSLLSILKGGSCLIITLALSYFPVELPPKYLRRCNVSLFRVRDGIGVGPSRQKHQESFLVHCSLFFAIKHEPWKNPEDCIATSIFVFEVKPSVGSHASAAYITALPPSAEFTGVLPVTLPTFSSESTHLEVGFPLRCFQRLSAPHMATQRLPLAR